MKTIKFYKLPEHIKNITFDGDEEDLRLHSDDTYRWARKTKKGYKEVEKKLNNFEIKGSGWIMYAWCDVSGFEYWMKNMCEYNYIQISISFESDNLKISEIQNIDNALFTAKCFAEQIEEDNNISFDY